jgi:hypothetical protein
MPSADTMLKAKSRMSWPREGDGGKGAGRLTMLPASRALKADRLRFVEDPVLPHLLD